MYTPTSNNKYDTLDELNLSSSIRLNFLHLGICGFGFFFQIVDLKQILQVTGRKGYFSLDKQIGMFQKET